MSVKMQKGMRMKKTLALLIVVSAGHAVSSYANTFDYSYTFSDGLVVSGTLQGTASGDYVTGVSDVTVNINGTPLTGTIFAATLGGSGWENGPVISFDAANNNFLFINSDVVHGDYGYTTDFYFFQDMVGVAGVDFNFAAPASWSLTDPVPDGGYTAMLCGMSLLALGWLRRKLA
jgi:hypothetical protein